MLSLFALAIKARCCLSLIVLHWC